MDHRHICDQGGDRLDHYLAAQKICTSRSEAGKWIKEKLVRVNGRLAKASLKLQEKDVITWTPPSLKSTDLVPQKMDLDILFEDEHLLVLNKPSGLVVHPGAGHFDRSLVHGLLHHCKDLSGIGGVERPGIVHRLDKGTSGVMVVAKNDKAHQHLSEQFKNKITQKEYLAICLGALNKKEQTLVHLMKRAEMNRKKFVVNQKKGKEAITHVHLLKNNSRLSVVQVKIETGRTHQIRVHLNHIGHPIVGDETYGGTKKLKDFDETEKKVIRDLGHPLLHARSLSFVHPKTDERVSFAAKPPQDWLDFATAFLNFDLVM